MRELRVAHRVAQAAGDRVQAQADRDALLHQLAIAETDQVTATRTRVAGLADLHHHVDRARRTTGQLVVAYFDVPPGSRRRDGQNTASVAARRPPTVVGPSEQPMIRRTVRRAHHWPVTTVSSLAARHYARHDRPPLTMNKTKRSAGLLLYRRREHRLEVFLAHMGGPFWARKDDGAWSMVKGEYDEPEDAFLAASREFLEETGGPPPSGTTLALGEIRQPSGKRITAWAIEGDFDPATVRSNTFTLEWPRGSGRLREFPEIDRAAWFDAVSARRRIVRGQVPFIDALEHQLRVGGQEVDLHAPS